jgi:putative ABC transport system permease protein
MKTGIPLAWLQLVREKRRLLAAVAGIAFAVILMLLQLGFEEALLGSAGLFHSHLKADLVLISPQYQFLLSSKSITERRLYQALGFPGVESISSVDVGQLPIKNPQTHQERVIFIVGFDPRSTPVDLPGVQENLAQLRRPDVALFDAICRPEFGPVAAMVREQGRAVTEIAGRRIEITGLIFMGTSFGVDGTVITSDETFLQLFPGRPPGLVDIGLVRLKPGIDAEVARVQLAGFLGDDVRVLTHKGFVDLEKNFWTGYTPIGFVFRLGTLIAIVVGTAIVYQILYSDVSEHLPEYATLKAMGYPQRYLFSVILQEALILSVFGFVPGLVMSQGLYTVAQAATLLPIHMTIARSVTVYLLTALMCIMSGALATRRLKYADPAEII